MSHLLDLAAYSLVDVSFSYQLLILICLCIHSRPPVAIIRFKISKLHSFEWNHIETGHLIYIAAMTVKCVFVPIGTSQKLCCVPR